MLLAFECGRCCLSHTGSKEQPLESKVDSCPLQEKQTDTNSSHSPSPGGSKTSYKGAVPHLLLTVPNSLDTVSKPQAVSPRALTKMGDIKGSREKTSAQLVAQTWQRFPQGTGRLAGSDKVKKGKQSTEKNKKCCSELQRGLWREATLLLHFLPFFFCLF